MSMYRVLDTGLSAFNKDWVILTIISCEDRFLDVEVKLKAVWEDGAQSQPAWERRACCLDLGSLAAELMFSVLPGLSLGLQRRRRRRLRSKMEAPREPQMLLSLAVCFLPFSTC